MISILRKFGPGLLFAGAAVGVSHLVQSTRAGADYGLGLIWALILIHFVKYPFFQFGPRYATATGESLLDGYKKLGKGVLILYFIITFATMFTIQTAVTIVTAGLAQTLFGDMFTVKQWNVIILGVCVVLLIIGKYKLLDNLMKFIIIILSVSTLIAVVIALNNNTHEISFAQILPQNSTEIVFLIAFMGWMPAPLDISIWHSLWAIEKAKDTSGFSTKSSLFDFNIGYFSTIILGIGFVLLGTLIMKNSGQSLSSLPGEFSVQLIEMYTSSLGNWSYFIIGIAAFTTMFSTSLTTLDASPRAMHKTTQLVFNKPLNKGYTFWLIVLITGTLSIYFFFLSEMETLIMIATILSFLTAPFYAIINYKLICSEHTPAAWRPSKLVHFSSWLGIIFLIGFSIWYIISSDIFNIILRIFAH